MGHPFRRLFESVAADVTPEMVRRRCLVLAPHPDDEVLGCGGTIAAKVRAGASVTVAILTDGRRGGVGPAAEVRALREAEAGRAAEALGLTGDQVVFFGYEDGRLREHVDEATERVRGMIAALGVDELLAPYRREYHPDHRTAWTIADACRRTGMCVFEYPVWFGPWLWDRLGWRARVAAATHLADALRMVKVSVADVAGVKRRAFEAYRSQIAAFEREGPWGRAYLNGFLGDYELFFVWR
jgi:LmbE family N-acetylglucosaminyl deacetylase